MPAVRSAGDLAGDLDRCVMGFTCLEALAPLSGYITHPAPSSRVRGYGDMRVERSAAYWIRVGIYLGWHSTSAREIYLRSSFQSTKADVSMISIHYKPTFSRFNAEGSPPTHLMPGLHDWPPVADQQWPSPRFRLIPQLWDDS
ncbi:hypothetical protein M8818_007397 [Zalaria obscura]|uniref:Uncharacterized protein n=1 Tax=Zalaria obscura TaxID=2024903 RepID=A0ACC3S369_9PEZI